MKTDKLPNIKELFQLFLTEKELYKLAKLNHRLGKKLKKRKYRLKKREERKAETK